MRGSPMRVAGSSVNAARLVSAALTSSSEASSSARIASAVASSVESEAPFSSPVVLALWISLRLGVGDPRFEEVAVQLAARGGVAAVSVEHSRVGTRVEVEAVVRWVAEQTVEVGVLDHDRATGSDRGPHPSQEVDQAA